MRLTRAQIHSPEYLSHPRPPATCSSARAVEKIDFASSWLLSDLLDAYFLPLSGLFALLLMVSGSAIAGPKEEAKIDFNRDIRPILSDHCYACHGPDENKRKGGLRLDRQEEALKMLKSGNRAIVPGDLEKSTLVQR